MIVTALRELSRGRVEVQLDGAAWRVLPVDAVARAGLGVGRPLDRATARTLAQELRRAGALRRATRALAARDRSRRSLEDRLARAGVPGAARDAALDALEDAGIVDDARTALSRAESLAARGFGDAAILETLERDGIASELAAETVAGLEPERRRASRLVGSGAGPKELRRLAAKGFSEDTLGELGGFAESP